VEFCGYTIPHPSETKMNVRIQTWEDTGTTAFDALRKGLEDLMDACDVISEKFTQARDDFDESNARNAI
jgi:DNA-directed RNA polymerase I and III subunit RPAC2